MTTVTATSALHYRRTAGRKTTAHKLDQTKKADLPAYAKPFVGKYKHLHLKHVLSPGKWHVDNGEPEGEVWNVDDGEIRQLSQDYDAYMRAGNSPANLTWDHSDSARDACGDVLRVFRLNGRNYALIGTNDDKAAAALDNRMPVSIQANPDAVDGKGNKYKTLLTHVALCQRPVVTDQEPAKRLLSRGRRSRSSPMELTDDVIDAVAKRLGFVKNGGRYRLASDDSYGDDTESTDDVPADDSTPTETEEPAEDEAPEQEMYGATGSATKVPVAAVVDALNDICGHDISDRVTTWNELLIALEHEEGNEPDGDEDEDNADDTGELPMLTEDTDPLLSGAPQMSQPKGKDRPRRLAQVEAERDELKAKLDAVLGEQKERARKAKEKRKLSFTNVVNQLCKDGQVTAAEKPGLMEMGEKLGWNDAVLAPYKRLSAQVPQGGKNRKRASVAAPENERKFDDDARKKLKDAFMGGNMGRGSITGND